MQNTEKLLSYFREGVAGLLQRGTFENGHAFRKTQREALEAYRFFLDRRDLTSAQKVRGFFEIPTGIGKTALFLALIQEVVTLSKADGERLRISIIVPTIQLLKQTAKNVRAYASTLSQDIGFYGDLNFRLEKPLTIMTYEAFTALTETKQLTSENVDILISDEAHRGISERRIHNLYHAFDDTTVQLAFTATSRFDATKSVEQTHHTPIYTKAIATAVVDDELADYIHTQLYVIRVEPSSIDVDDNVPHPHLAMRKAAWNNRVVAQFREGYDQQTDHLLSDNATAFFVADTDHADTLEEQLNSDLVLRKRARNGGFDDVAIAIHSKLSRKEQRRRMDAYLSGRYMSAVGDGKFKEGFDHPPMKTIFDFPRTSVVDKAQILGRGARKWFNPSKNRSEGLTFMDYIVYVGSENAQEDASRLNRAKTAACYVWDVLEATAAYSVRAVRFAETTRERRPQTKLAGQSVEAYETLEEVRTLRSEVEAMRGEDYVPYTEEMLTELLTEKARVGLGAKRLLACMRDIPSGMDSSSIERLFTPNPKRVRGAFYNATLAAYRALPDGPPMVELEGDAREELRAHAARTGLGARALWTLMKQPADLDEARIYMALTGGLWSIERQYYNAILEEYQRQPDAIVVDVAQQALLAAELKRTGLGNVGVYNRIDDPPSHVTLSKVTTLVRNIGRRPRLNTLKDVYQGVLSALRAAPDGAVVAFTGDMQSRLILERERTQLGPEAIFAKIPNRPPGLTRGMVTALFYKRATIKPRLFKLLIEAYAAQPTSMDILHLTPEHYAVLHAERKRTNKTFHAAAYSVAKNKPPEGFDANVATNLERGIRTVMRRSHYDAILSAYSAMPDLPNEIRPVALTAAWVAELQAERARTGLGAYALFQRLRDKAGLSGPIVKTIVAGEVMTVQPRHLALIKKTYADQPTAIHVTDEMLARLQSEVQRTGLGCRTLFKKVGRNFPGTTEAHFANLLAGAARSTSKDVYEAIIAFYAALPDKNIRPLRGRKRKTSPVGNDR